MQHFRTTTHLSEILEESNKQSVIIFKYSNECRSSDRLKDRLEKEVVEKKIVTPIYLLTVQTQPALSEKIEKHFAVKHESPQILVINRDTVTYTAHHNHIDVEKL